MLLSDTTIVNSNLNSNTLTLPQDYSSSNQLTITKQHHKNPLFNLFHHHHTQNASEQLNRFNNSSTNLIDYSSDALLQYCRDNNLNAVKEIINFDFNNIKTEANELNQADTANNLQALKRIKIDLEFQDEANQTPLIIATRNNCTEIALLLIEHNANINAHDLDSWTPLLNASREGNIELVEKLLARNASIECRDCGGFTPLTWACYKNHVEIVRILIQNGANANAQCKNSISCLSWSAGRGFYEVVTELLKVSYIKVNSQDRNSSTPLLWAARSGSLAVCEALLKKGANPELIGMNNMTPLIISCKFGHLSVALNLTKVTETSINHLDKDGHSALSLAAKNGYTDIVLRLLDKGAYVNIPNKKGDSVLITAVKNGHKSIMDALLSKHIEIDAIGSQGKTALHHAIEKGSADLVRSLLAYKPDLEIVAQDGDTLLLLAVKKKATIIVNELLNYGSKVSPTDKNGDNVLHVSLRNRSREITELILANPKNSKYLYKPNKKGETPHKIDASNPKSILTQIFGARQLNMTEDSILGYDLYSSAIAEILSEPSLHTPITVGLYAKWGSGKSFLLSQLKTEMKSFAKLTRVYNLEIDKFLLSTILVLNLALLSPFFFWKWSYGLALFTIVSCSAIFLIAIFKFFSERREKEWAERVCQKLSIHLSRIKLLFKVLFLNPDSVKQDGTFEHKHLKFIFTEYGKISTIGGENSLALMVASLYSKIEQEIGIPVARLCRVFYNKNHSHGKFKRFCCIPTCVLVVLFVLLLITIAIFFRVKGFSLSTLNEAEQGFLITISFIILVSIVGSSYTWLKIVWNLIRSPKSRIINIAHSNGNYDSKVERFIFKLKREVDLISHTIRTIDSFSHSCTRLCIVIDGLDSCEQSRVVQILEIVHVLFTREGDPFISILAVDPHVLIKGIEGNLTAVFRNGSVNGHDYLRSIIHLPVFLQVDLSVLEKFKSKTIGQIYQKRMSNATMMGSSQDALSKFDSDLKKKVNKKGKNRRSGRSSQKPMSAYDLTDQLIKSDYFLDVNPRNLRRLVNIIALTGRLLRAYHIDFNWRMLASWIYLNEQWPYRCSWIVMHYEEHDADFNDETSLNEIYNRIKNQIPTCNEPLLELDRNPRKFEQFLQNSKPTLNVVILKKILPCTCNLDPYLIKLIKDSIDSALVTQDKLNFITNSNSSATNLLSSSNSNSNQCFPTLNNQLYLTNQTSPYVPNLLLATSDESNQLVKRRDHSLYDTSNQSDNNCFKIDMSSKALTEMSIQDLCEAIDQDAIESLSDNYKQIYKTALKESNINGKVLSFCNLDELKYELKMAFGDWQLFRNWVLMKRFEQQQYRSTNQSKASLPQPIQTVESKPDPVTPTIQLAHRKVEFFITPVIEISDASNPANNIKLPVKESSTKSVHKENIFDSLETNESKTEDKSLESNTSSTTLASENDANKLINEQRSRANSSVSKFGKRIFESIENLFNKNSTSMSSLNATYSKKDVKQTDDDDDDSDDESETDDSVDDDETEKKDNLLKQSETNTTILSLATDETENSDKSPQKSTDSNKSKVLIV